MRVTITCENGAVADKVYDLLVEHNQGQRCLHGSKICTDECIMVPDIMVFDLTGEEIKEVSKIPGVLSVKRDIDDITLHYEKIGQQGFPRLASFKRATWSSTDTTLSGKQIPHSLLFGQTYESFYTNSPQTSGSILASLSSINCSNVDVIVFDSGVDASHPDFLDSNGISNVVGFNWTLLKEGDPLEGTQIVSNQSVDYYKDYGGHGTAVASLVAGNRCGFAKNAKIYSLRIQGLDSTAFSSQAFTVTQGLKLALAFQKAKKKNLFNLDSTRPTIMVNSWGYAGPYTSYDLMLESISENDVNLIYCIDKGKILPFYNNSGFPTSRMLGNDSYSDGYFRQFLKEGIHVVKSAGNENTFMVNDPSLKINVHIFELLQAGLPTGTFYSKVVTQENLNSYTIGSNYVNFAFQVFKYIGTDAREFTSSPNIGTDRNKSDYPVIVVGDVIPIGYGDVRSDIYFSAGNADSALQLLSSTTDSNILVNQNTLYNSKSGSFFVKSSYSNFGPDVDIYAPGNGTWAAHSNQVKFTTSYPIISTTPNNAFKFFNGTSASCPIVAGMLATFLSEFPSTPPLSARAWLLNAAVSGNIMETQSNFLTVSTCYDTGITKTYNLAFGSNKNNFNLLPPIRMDRYGGTLEQNYKTGNIYDLLFCNRFFKSNNLLAQAYPIRKMLLKSNDASVKIGDTVLKKKWDYNSKSKTVQKFSNPKQQQPITKNIGIPNFGRLHVSGNNNVASKQLGIGSNTNPVTFLQPTSTFAVEALNAGPRNSLILSGDLLFSCGEKSFSINFEPFGSSTVFSTNFIDPIITIFSPTQRLNNFFQLSANQRFQDLFMGYGTAYFLSGTKVVAMGINNAGQLGNGTTSTDILNPRHYLSGNYTGVFPGVGFVYLLSGSEAYSFGTNRYGQLGLNMPTNNASLVREPQRVPGNWKKFACGWSHTLALSTPGISGSTLFVAGSGPIGITPLGTVINTLTALTGLWSDIEAGTETSFVRDFKTGQWYVCGNNDAGQLGMGNKTTYLTENILNFVPLTGTLNKFDKIIPNPSWTVAIQNNKIYTAGGLNNFADRPYAIPLNINQTPSSNFQQITGTWYNYYSTRLNRPGNLGDGYDDYASLVIEAPNFPECIEIIPTAAGITQGIPNIRLTVTNTYIIFASNNTQLLPIYEGKDINNNIWSIKYRGGGYGYSIYKNNGCSLTLPGCNAVSPSVSTDYTSITETYKDDDMFTTVLARVSSVECYY